MFGELCELASCAHGYDITWAKIFLRHEHLGSSIASCAAVSVEESASLEFAREPEITKFHSAVLIEKNVLELEIAMDDPLLMYVADGEAELAKDNAAFIFRKAALLREVVEQLTT